MRVVCRSWGQVTVWQWLLHVLIDFYFCYFDHVIIQGIESIELFVDVDFWWRTIGLFRIESRSLPIPRSFLGTTTSFQTIYLWIWRHCPALPCGRLRYIEDRLAFIGRFIDLRCPFCRRVLRKLKYNWCYPSFREPNCHGTKLNDFSLRAGYFLYYFCAVQIVLVLPMLTNTRIGNFSSPRILQICNCSTIDLHRQVVEATSRYHGD